MAAQAEVEAQPSILVLDHNQRNLELLAQFLGQAGYHVLAARATWMNPARCWKLMLKLAWR